jgi:NAD(P)-dependent dehydrogenase (short-subunit alcohol dehydrogenase family)
MPLDQRVVVITGAAGGLGAVVTRTMAQQGAQLALIGSQAERLNQLAAGLNLAAPAFTYAANLADPQAAQAAAQAVANRFGRVEVVLHLVGGWVGGQPVVETPAADLANMLQQHVWTTFYMAQAFVPHLVRNGWGRLMVVSAPSALRPNAKGAPYAIGKAGQQALMLTLAQELKGTGVTANSILVNAIDTAHERAQAPSPKNASWATPEEIAALMVYLCSDEAQLVNGAQLPLYGG